ncbi:MAG: DNA cytosine methyltransferase [Muribaculaceae bacterium]|nr:DNA cytosine methyltransferase [Muribaculaceae bacterium]
MASIVAQQQDLFLEFVFEECVDVVHDLTLAKCRDDIFLIGCFRNDQKKQLDWILSKKTNGSLGKYNVRLGKGRNGWINKDNPRIANPQFVVLYEFGNENVVYCFQSKGSKVYTEHEMAESGYEQPQGDYLVYNLIRECNFSDLDIKKVLALYRERTNWIDGKPIFLSGREIVSAMRPKKKRDSINKKNNVIIFDHNAISIDRVLSQINHNYNYSADALTSIDLFSGCGGLTKGLSMAGIRSILASDIDENCEKTFRRNFPDVPFLCKDVTTISKEEVDFLTGNVLPDIIVGGPPCQGFSLANKRRNKVSDDPRNRLFYGFVKFINWYSPKLFVMENVKGLLSMQKGAVLQTIIEEFGNAGKFGGYEVDYRVLLASDYGVPQNRERVIIIGVRKDLGLKPAFPEPLQLDHKITLDEAISDLPQINACEGLEVMSYPVEPQNDYQRLMRSNMQYVLNHIAMNHTKRLVERFKAIQPGQSLIDVWDTHGSVKRGAPDQKSTIKFSQNNQRLFGDQPAPTIAASFQSNFIHPHLNRNFTAREGARIQSFPDDFVFEGMRTKMSWEKGLSQYQQIGNAVPVLLAKAIGECINGLLKQ